MNFAILSAGEGWHVRDLQRACQVRGHSTVVADFRVLSATVDRPKFADVDAVIVRTMPVGSLEQVIFRMDMLHRASADGLRVFNKPLALETCIDKYLTLEKLAAAGLPVPRTMVCQGAEDALSAFEQLGRDVVVKPLFGSEGRGLVRITDSELAYRTFHTLEQLQAVAYVQEFIRHPGWDLRAFVLGGKLLGAMRRYSKNWRTNIAQGGWAEPALLAVDVCDMALQAAAVVGAEVAGVDLLPVPTGMVVLEVNAVPGWKALAPTCGLDVADRIIQYLAESRHDCG